MANLSNRNTSIKNQPNFKEGDKVYCPNLGDGIFTLNYISIDCLAIVIGNVECLFRPDGRGYFTDGQTLPQLFHVTEANRQAIYALYGIKVSFYPNHWERKHGYVNADGVFYCPKFNITKDGERLEIHGVTHSYGYVDGYQILMHLQAASDANYELTPMLWLAAPQATLESDLPAKEAD